MKTSTDQLSRPDAPPANNPVSPVIMVIRHDERSQLEHVPAPQGAGRVPGPTADRAAGEVVLAALRSQVEQLRVQDQRVRHKVAGSVTRMRVATRRLRSTLRGFSSILDPERTRLPADELKWLSAQLAEEHDIQVMVERFTQVVRELPEHLILGTVAADVQRALGQLIDDGEQTVQAALDSKRYRALQDTLEQLLNQPPLTHRAGQPALAELPSSVAKASRKLNRLLDAAAAAPPGPDRDTALHEARKACKRVRYMTEIVAPVVGQPAHDLHRQTEKLQELLGNYQDAVEARPVLQQLGEAAHADGHNAFTYGLLYASEHARMDRVLHELPHQLQRLSDEETLSWLQPNPRPHRLASAIRPVRLLNRGRSVGLQAHRCISALAAFRRRRWADLLAADAGDEAFNDGPTTSAAARCRSELLADLSVAPLGRFIRRLSLDELPQRLNMLRGELSLDGPRPPLPQQVNMDAADGSLPGLVKPGLTGLWHISGRRRPPIAREGI